MKLRALLTLVGFAISLAVLTFAQQKDTVDPELRQQLHALGKKMNDALDKNDAAAVAACFTEDGVYVTNTGPVNGREAIKKWFADDFQEWHHSNDTSKWDLNSPRIIGTAVAVSGAWSATIQGKTGAPIHLEGYWSEIDIREGNDWKFQMMTFNLTPAPAAPAQTK
jgi:uncharacterized protein (TIGR02246 family)